MPGKTLVVLGSGPGIGLHVARAFSVRGFTHIALVSRNQDQLKQDQDSVYDAIQERGYSCQVRTWAGDLTDTQALKKILGEIEGFGGLECVLYNAARVAGKPPGEEPVEDMERDFKLTNLSLYTTFLWAQPLLARTSSPPSNPAFIVTSTTQLWKEPLPALVTLSMVKSAQRALVLSLHATYGESIHVALLSVGGVVGPDRGNLSPENIAERAWELYSQSQSSWKRELEIAE